MKIDTNYQASAPVTVHRDPPNTKKYEKDTNMTN